MTSSLAKKHRPLGLIATGATLLGLIIATIQLTVLLNYFRSLGGRSTGGILSWLSELRDPEFFYYWLWLLQLLDEFYGWASLFSVLVCMAIGLFLAIRLQRRRLIYMNVVTAILIILWVMGTIFVAMTLPVIFLP